MANIPISNNTFQVYPLFTGTDSGCTNAIYLLPPSFSYNQPSKIIINLLFAGSALPGQAAVAATNNADFTIGLVQSGTGGPTQANVTTTITLTGLNMWKCAPEARATLMQNYVLFLQNVETNLELAGFLVPGATRRIAGQIADNMVSPPAESAFYRYSLVTGFGAALPIPYVDVLAGMRLRLETETSQFLSPSSTMNGYVAAGRSTYYVNTVPTAAGNGARVMAFDAFLGSIKSPNVGGTAPTPLVAGGLLDLQVPGGARAYWRLFYPAAVQPPSAPGDFAMTDNISLVGAQTLALLNSVTSGFEQSSPPPPPAGNVYAIFAGRSLVVPEIPVWITPRGQTTLDYVPVGTTITNIIERYTQVPMVPGQSSITVSRPTAAGTSFNLAPLTTGLSAIPTAMFDVPLIPGDTVTLQF
jgi:hypothetical protein